MQPPAKRCCGRGDIRLPHDRRFSHDRAAVRAFVDDMSARERDGILSLSLIPSGFPLGRRPRGGREDVAVAMAMRSCGARCTRIWPAVLVDAPKTATLTGGGQRQRRARCGRDAATSGPLVLADVADTAGRGARPGDSTFMLRAMLERGIENAVTGTYCTLIQSRWTRVSKRAKVQRSDLRFGLQAGRGLGRTDRRAGNGDARARNTRAGRDGRHDSGARSGRSAWICTQGIDIVLASIACSVFTQPPSPGLALCLWTNA